MPQPKNEDIDLLKKLQVAVEWNTKLIEFQILADMSHSHAQMVAALADQADRNEWQANAAMQKPKDPKPGSTWNDEEARAKRAQLMETVGKMRHDATLFKAMYNNELKAVEKLTKEIMPVFKRKYPIIAQKVADDGEVFDDTKEVMVDKCFVCGAPAFAKLKKGAVCRGHFSQEKKKEMIDDANKPVTPQPAPNTTVSPRENSAKPLVNPVVPEDMNRKDGIAGEEVRGAPATTVMIDEAEKMEEKKDAPVQPDKTA